MPQLEPVVDINEWAERYGLKLDESMCLKCKKMFSYTTPVAIPGYRGVMHPLHECGPNYRRTIFKPTGKDEVKFWMDFKYGSADEPK